MMQSIQEARASGQNFDEEACKIISSPLIPAMGRNMQDLVEDELF